MLDIRTLELAGVVLEQKATPRDAEWLANAPMAKLKKLAELKLPEPVKRALAAKLSNGELNDLLAALQMGAKELK